MTSKAPDILLISVIGRDQVGVVSAVTSYLFDAGANLADSSYAVLGEGFEFSCVAEFPAGASGYEIRDGLTEIELLRDARISVSRFPFQLERGVSGSITHVVEITGGDRPGLIARISEVLVDYGANIVRMNSRRIGRDGGFDYRTRFAINMGQDRFDALESALYNTSGSLRLECSVQKVDLKD